jgi:hypothetical protein
MERSSDVKNKGEGRENKLKIKQIKIYACEKESS